MIELQWKRPDGTYVAIVNGGNYHVIPGEPLWEAAVAQAAELGDALLFEPEPEPLPLPPTTRLAKADLWRRLTDAEAVTLDAALLAAPVRLRRIYEAASYLDATDPDFPELRAGIIAALGETRADEVLAPTY
jgi:hypothetical protein